MTYTDALNLMHEHTQSDALRKHMYAVEAAMRSYAKKYGEDEETWAIVGVLHDFDYEKHPTIPEHPMKGSEILKEKGKEVWSVTPKSTVFDALKVMSEKGIGALMVMDDGKVKGIITERDYARKIILIGKASPKTAVEEIMTPAENLYTVKPETNAEECMVLITGKRIRHLPVFDGGALVGLVSIGDVVKSIISEQEILLEHLSDFIAGKYGA